MLQTGFFEADVTRWEIKYEISLTQQINKIMERSDFLILVFNQALVKSYWLSESLSFDRIKDINESNFKSIFVALNNCNYPFGAWLFENAIFEEKEDGFERGFSTLLESVQSQKILEPLMVPIPAGEFLMGSDPEVDVFAKDIELPQHRLCLPDFYISKFPVTVQEYQAFALDTDRTERLFLHPKYKCYHPVVGVTFYDARDYCSWLTESTGRHYRLPTEAEWEKAARGTDGRIFPWGNVWEQVRCNTREYGRRNTLPVGHFSPGGDSPYGVADMAGGVEEWTSTLWGVNESFSEPQFEYPYDPGDGREGAEIYDPDLLVVRGGHFSVNYQASRCAHRWRFTAGTYIWFGGFRVVSPDPI
jgi:formylglycine-generating enzyme required for sulfatase activity